MAKAKKTNAVRLLDSLRISFETIEYEIEDEHNDGISVAQKVGKDPEEVFKTLVTHSQSGQHYVFVIPVTAELDLKKAAQAAGEKKIEMLPLKLLLQTTGYIKGGCSPLGMKKVFPTFVDEQVEILNTITCSAGRVGLQMTLSTDDFITATEATIVPLCKL